MEKELKSMHVLWEEVKEAIHSMKSRSSPGIDNIPAELLKCGEEENEGIHWHVLQHFGNQAVAERIDAITSHTSAEKGEPEAVPELSYDEPD